jgi:hypothetical protein
MPEVTLDVHEYGAISETWIEQGMVKDAEIMVGGVTNPNIDQEIAAMGRDLFIPTIGERVEAAGYSFHRYVVGSPFDGRRMRYSTTDLNDGRQSMGIYNTLSFIQEGKRYADQITHAERRADSQMTGMLALLETVARNAHDVIETVERCRERIMTRGAYQWAHVQMDYFPDPAEPTVPFPIFDLYEWRHAERELEHFEPRVLPKKSVRRPLGYLFSPQEERLMRLLDRHQIQMKRLKEAQELAAETYTIHHVTVMDEEELQVPNVDVITDTSVRQFPVGTVFVPLEQPAGILIPLLLEPQSTRGILAEGSAHQYHFGAYLVEGEEYPIHRHIATPQKRDEITLSVDGNTTE